MSEKGVAHVIEVHAGEVHAREVHAGEVDHEVKIVVKDQVEEKISHIEDVDIPVHQVHQHLQIVVETEVVKDPEDQEVKIEIKKINDQEVVVQIEKKDQVIKMIPNLQRPGMIYK